MKVMIMEVPCLKRCYIAKYKELYNRYFIEIAKIIREGQKKGVFSKTISSPLVFSFTLYGVVTPLSASMVSTSGSGWGERHIPRQFGKWSSLPESPPRPLLP